MNSGKIALLRRTLGEFEQPAWRRMSVSLTMIFAMTNCSFAAVNPPPSGTDAVIEASQTVPGSTKERGNALRAALQQTYQRLQEGQLRIDGFSGADVTEVVLPYIPKGATFSDAEAVLRQAGFIVEPRPDVSAPSNPNRSQDWYAVLARFSPFATRFPFRYDLYVSLLPDAPGNYTTVSKLSATFFVSGP